MKRIFRCFSCGGTATGPTGIRTRLSWSAKPGLRGRDGGGTPPLHKCGLRRSDSWPAAAVERKTPKAGGPGNSTAQRGCRLKLGSGGSAARDGGTATWGREFSFDGCQRVKAAAVSDTLLWLERSRNPLNCLSTYRIVSDSRSRGCRFCFEDRL